MGRKSKEQLEREANAQTVEMEKPMAKEKSELTHTAISIVKTNGKWHLVKIKYNPETKEVGDVELVPQDDKMDAVYNFKIVAGDEIIPE